MLLLAGIVLIVVGLLSGGALLAAPFGVLPASPGLALWIFFPTFIVLGYVLFVVAAGTAQVRTLSRVAAAILLALAIISAVVLFLVEASIARPASGTASLWYVLIVGVVLGTGSLAMHRLPAAGA